MAGQRQACGLCYFMSVIVALNAPCIGTTLWSDTVCECCSEAMTEAFMPMSHAMSNEPAGFEVENSSNSNCSSSSSRSISSASCAALRLPADDFKVRLHQNFFGNLAADCPSQLACMVAGLMLPTHLLKAGQILPVSTVYYIGGYGHEGTQFLRISLGCYHTQ